MILPFTVAALAVTLKGIGDITALQRINDAGWVRAEMGSISRGTLANGLANMFAGWSARGASRRRPPISACRRRPGSAAG